MMTTDPACAAFRAKERPAMPLPMIRKSDRILVRPPVRARLRQRKNDGVHETAVFLERFQAALVGDDEVGPLRLFFCRHLGLHPLENFLPVASIPLHPSR